MPVPIISPSLLACDLADLARESKSVIDAGCDCAFFLRDTSSPCVVFHFHRRSPFSPPHHYHLSLYFLGLHVDIMDGHFVPNITFGPGVVASLHKHVPDTYLDCHLMVTDPGKWVDAYADAGASGFTFHVEALADVAAVAALADRAVARGMRAGLAVRPSTSAAAFITALQAAPSISLALIMTVEPGFGGQPFRIDQLPKISAVRAALPLIDIQVDGGLDSSTTFAAAQAGANVIVAGTSIFRAADRAVAIKDMRDKASRPFELGGRADV